LRRTLPARSLTQFFSSASLLFTLSEVNELP
jgi:hypothetical protein